MSHSTATLPQGRRLPPVAHHFETMEQQHTSAVLGMWLFLVTEILLFSGLFCGYAVFRTLHPEVFQNASQFLDWRMGTLNTFVLITSSLTMALAVRAAQTNRYNQLFWMLITTVCLAATFMVVKYFEYTHKFHLGIFPGQWFNPVEGHGESPNFPYARNFFSIYYMMTGLHGLHVLFGMIAIGWLIWRCRPSRRDFWSEYYTPVEVVGLYWHLVDLIWIYLFPLLYLID